MQITYNGAEYELSTKLRVAFQIQNRFNHKPYAQLFQSIDSMGIEEQIRMLYISFNLANPNVLSEIEFQNYILDNWGIAQVTETVAHLVEAIMFNGLSDEEVAERKKALAVQ